MIYLDNAATTFPKPEAVYEAMDKMNRCGAVNAGRGSYELARKADKLIADTKQKIRNLIKVNVETPVIFSSSVTIALNQIINGLPLQDGSIVYVSPYEHNAVARTLYQLAKTKHIKINQLPLKEETLEIDIEKMKYEFLKEKPTAVFCTHISNVTGYILPIDKIFSEAKKYGAITILDCAQSLGLIEINASLLCADIIAFAGHKTLYGPFGIGGFVNVTNVSLDVVITGGTGSDSLNLEMPNGNEKRYEASSSNIVAISGLDAALNELEQEKIYETEKKMTKYFIQKLKNVQGVHMFLPHNEEQHIGIVAFTVDGFLAEEVGVILDEDFDIAVRTGYHCAPFIHEYLKDYDTRGVVRASLSRFSTREHIDALVKALEEVIRGD